MRIPLAQIYLPQQDLRAAVDEDALDELAASLRDHGQLQAIGVRPWQFETTNRDIDEMDDAAWLDYIANGGRFEVVFGARRTRAAMLNEWTHIEGNVVAGDAGIKTEAKKLIENVQRLNLTPIEEGHALASMLSDSIADIRELQRRTGKSRAWIKDRLDLVALPDDLQAAVHQGLIGTGVAQILGKIQHNEVRRQFLEHAIDNGCTNDQAKMWLAQAQFAEQGINSTKLTPEQIEEMSKQPEIVEQKFPCFGCGDYHTWRTVNTLIFCGTCQNGIAEARDQIKRERLMYTEDDTAIPS